ncbi:hypothetical protein TRFO_08232 [Tritrichomonas foetus]|uniref:Uncharacterized protein n=1 Tax=Tritrichomonas foetus TaxID=1144522 RepID=A0A1J4JQX2_9EUKA|nr:hypothetical protein TRFO_08232 [Tritrichomonas foetus]|eukprot:OHS99907.1 hypothetical protein TRFO_08232 [Tritrichomonas foetus]
MSNPFANTANQNASLSNPTVSNPFANTANQSASLSNPASSNPFANTANQNPLPASQPNEATTSKTAEPQEDPNKLKPIPPPPDNWFSPSAQSIASIPASQPQANPFNKTANNPFGSSSATSGQPLFGQGGFGAPQGGFGAPQGGFGAPQGGFGAPAGTAAGGANPISNPFAAKNAAGGNTTFASNANQSTIINLTNPQKSEEVKNETKESEAVPNNASQTENKKEPESMPVKETTQQQNNQPEPVKRNKPYSTASLKPPEITFMKRNYDSFANKDTLAEFLIQKENEKKRAIEQKRKEEEKKKRSLEEKKKAEEERKKKEEEKKRKAEEERQKKELIVKPGMVELHNYGLSEDTVKLIAKKAYEENLEATKEDIEQKIKAHAQNSHYQKNH